MEVESSSPQSKGELFLFFFNSDRRVKFWTLQLICNTNIHLLICTFAADWLTMNGFLNLKYPMGQKRNLILNFSYTATSYKICFWNKTFQGSFLICNFSPYSVRCHICFLVTVKYQKKQS